MAQLSLVLLRLFSSGELPGTTVHELASAAWADGWGRDFEIARKLVSAGGQGRQRSHIAGDIINAALSGGVCCSESRPYKLDLEGGASAGFISLTK